MKKNILITLVIILVGSILCLLIYKNYNNPKRIKYKQASTYLANNDYENAIKLFNELDDYKDSKDMIKESKYRQAKKLYSDGYITSAYLSFKELSNYKDTNSLLKDDIFNIIGLWSYTSYNSNNYIYISLDFSDSDNLVKQKIYVGKPGEEEKYQQYKIIDNDIYILNDNWDKTWHINSITSSTLIVKSLLSNNSETYTLAKAS